MIVSRKSAPVAVGGGVDDCTHAAVHTKGVRTYTFHWQRVHPFVVAE
jgi:hypothetical protein